LTALVFASPTPPFPLDNGGRVRMHRLLTGLASEFDTTFVTYEHDPASGRPACGRRELAELLPGIDVVTVPGLGPQPARASAAAGLRALVSPLPASWHPYHGATFARTLDDEVRRRRAHLVHFDYFAFFRSVPGVVNVRAPHNVESTIARHEAAHQRGYGRIWHEAEWRKLRALERRVLRDSQLCVAVSDADARALALAGARQVALCPNGTDPVRQLAPPTRDNAEPLRIVFVGAGAYPPYERGIAWFVRDVLPLVQARIPATLDVVGNRPQQPAHAPGVTYVGRVAEVRTWYERAHAAIVPVFEGSGTRLKIIEAMALGRPVVSTRLGAEGLPIASPTHYQQADDAAAFAAALVEIARWCSVGDERLASMLTSARAAAEPLFWPRIVERLCELYRGAIVNGPDPGLPASRAGEPGIDPPAG
jgi:glycosyltransferase involved in cell wall biosynthesis